MYKHYNSYGKIGIDKPVVLVGMMGAGKTTIGLRLAKKLSLPFIDTDEMVSRMVGCSLQEIFKYQSELYFRQKELEAINEALNFGVSVVATGGGSFVCEDVRESIAHKGTSVWLRVPLETLLERVSRKNTRPILEQGNKEEILKNLMNDRYPSYGAANIIVDSDTLTHYHVVNIIISKLQQYSRRTNAS